jgi:16S rRNA C1402 (ribose-2'-O) methylase RsmI
MSGESERTEETAAQATVAWIVGQALRPGDVLTHGWVIQRVERLEKGSRFAVTTAAPPLRLIIELPRPGNVYDARTERLGIWVDSADVLGSGDSRLREAIARDVADRIRAFDGGDNVELPMCRLPVHGSKPIFYLTPGHLGDPDDLSLRALQVIASVPIIFVENGKAEEVRALLRRFKLRPAEGPGAPEIIELGNDDTSAVERWRAAVAAGLDTCLFGGNEGIPGFCDPGKALVTAAAGLQDAVRIRSVGGSSALGHALMRLPSDLQMFEFGGLMHSEAEARRLTAALTLGRLPLVVFSHASAVRSLLPGVIKQSGLRRGAIHLLSALTHDEEHASSAAVADFVLPGPDVLPDYQPVVIVIERGWTWNATRGAFIERVIARIRRALANRTDDPRFRQRPDHSRCASTEREL